MKKQLLLFVTILLLAGISVSAQDTLSGQYFCKGKLLDITINPRIVLVYFRTSQINVEDINMQYNCRRIIHLSGDKADSLYACEVELPIGSYEDGLMWLRGKSEVYDVEPVIGTEQRVPVSNVFYVKLFDMGDTILLNIVFQFFDIDTNVASIEMQLTTAFEYGEVRHACHEIEG